MPLKFTFFENLKLSKKVHFYLYAFYKRLRGKKKRLKRNNYLVLHNHWSNGYHHWLSEVLVKIFHLDKPPQSYNLLLPESYPDFAFESLTQFPFRSITKIPKDQHLQLEEVTLVENPYSGNFSPKDIKTLRTYFWNSFRLHPQASQGIYISRARTLYRHVVNENEVVQWFRDRDFLILFAEELSFEEQVSLFSTCKVLVSIHGAGLTNAVFMRPGAYLIELYRELSNTDHMNSCFINLSQASDIHHRLLFCQVAKANNSNPNNADIYVDLKKLEKLLTPILSLG